MKTSAQIDQRRHDAHRRYHACGIEIVVHADDSVPLGAVPVLDARDWGGRPDRTGEFLMPLSPHVLIRGAPGPDLTPARCAWSRSPLPVETSWAGKWPARRV